MKTKYIVTTNENGHVDHSHSHHRTFSGAVRSAKRFCRTPIPCDKNAGSITPDVANYSIVEAYKNVDNAIYAFILKKD